MVDRGIATVDNEGFNGQEDRVLKINGQMTVRRES